MQKQLLFFLVSCLLLFSACSSPKFSDVDSVLKQKHPNAILLEHRIGEGDSEHAYVHLKYKESGSSSTSEAVWLFRKQSKSWVFVSEANNNG